MRSQRKIIRLVEAILKPARRKRTPKPPSRLETIVGFGGNPGRLVMKVFAPSRLQGNPPLVVVLHGCGQTPESLDAASNFSRLAKGRGFVLLYPEQAASNNPQRCFNWFRPSAVAHDRGELLSVKQMIEHASKRHGVDRNRVYIVGLSAGGAMTAVLVANYPDLFSGAAIVAGMPVGASRDAMSALRAMKSGAPRPAGGWGGRIAEISPGRKLWPPITVWHGTADRVVNPTNSDASVDQWLEAGGIDRSSGRVQKKNWGELRSWHDSEGFSVSLYSISGIAHGLPVKSREAAPSSTKDPYVLASKISAPLELMRLWGLSRR